MTQEIVIYSILSVLIGFIIFFKCNPYKKGNSYCSKPYYND